MHQGECQHNLSHRVYFLWYVVVADMQSYAIQIMKMCYWNNIPIKARLFDVEAAPLQIFSTLFDWIGWFLSHDCSWLNMLLSVIL